MAQCTMCRRACGPQACFYWTSIERWILLLPQGDTHNTDSALICATSWCFLGVYKTKKIPNTFGVNKIKSTTQNSFSVLTRGIGQTFHQNKDHVSCKHYSLERKQNPERKMHWAERRVIIPYILHICYTIKHSDHKRKDKRHNIHGFVCFSTQYTNILMSFFNPREEKAYVQ